MRRWNHTAVVGQKVSLIYQPCDRVFGSDSQRDEWFGRCEELRSQMNPHTKHCVSPGTTLVLPDGRALRESTPVSEADFAGDDVPARTLLLRAFDKGKLLVNYAYVEPKPVAAESQSDD